MVGCHINIAPAFQIVMSANVQVMSVSEKLTLETTLHLVSDIFSTIGPVRCEGDQKCLILSSTEGLIFMC